MVCLFVVVSCVYYPPRKSPTFGKPLLLQADLLLPPLVQLGPTGPRQPWSSEIRNPEIFCFHFFLATLHPNSLGTSFRNPFDGSLHAFSFSFVRGQTSFSHRYFPRLRSMAESPPIVRPFSSSPPRFPFVDFSQGTRILPFSGHILIRGAIAVSHPFSP